MFLYTNCGEFPESGANRYFDRRWPADRNLIEGNSFTGGLNGVWVGQRMGENTLPMECAKPAYATGPLRSITLDFAADNTIRANTFTDVTYGYGWRTTERRSTATPSPATATACTR
ncbi:MAG: hypothetical protein R2695_19250 [Acidimicrobiales bacterium]